MTHPFSLFTQYSLFTLLYHPLNQKLFLEFVIGMRVKVSRWMHVRVVLAGDSQLAFSILEASGKELYRVPSLVQPPVSKTVINNESMQLSMYLEQILKSQRFIPSEAMPVTVSEFLEPAGDDVWRPCVMTYVDGEIVMLSDGESRIYQGGCIFREVEPSPSYFSDVLKNLDFAPSQDHNIISDNLINQTYAAAIASIKKTK